MCLYPRLILNPKYLPSKKSSERIPVLTDKRAKYVPVACGQCKECRKQKANEWRVRLHEELKVNDYAYFVTLTFENEKLDKLCNELKTEECNAVAARAIRLFTERWRKIHKKALRHWLIPELGQDNSERLHIHGILFPPFLINNEYLNKFWKYGYTDTGKYCNSRSINYIVKYVTKIDPKHKNFVAQIFCSRGIGSNYTKKLSTQIKHRYNGKDTRDYYTLPNGAKVALPIYYRNKLYTEEQREKLWLFKLDKDIRYIDGVEIINASKNIPRIIATLKQAQLDNIALGYGDSSLEWKKHNYNVRLKDLDTP